MSNSKTSALRAASGESVSPPSAMRAEEKKTPQKPSPCCESPNMEEPSNYSNSPLSVQQKPIRLSASTLFLSTARFGSSSFFFATSATVLLYLVWCSTFVLLVLLLLHRRNLFATDVATEKHSQQLLLEVEQQRRLVQSVQRAAEQQQHEQVQAKRQRQDQQCKCLHRRRERVAVPKKPKEVNNKNSSAIYFRGLPVEDKELFFDFRDKFMHTQQQLEKDTHALRRLLKRTVDEILQVATTFTSSSFSSTLDDLSRV